MGNPPRLANRQVRWPRPSPSEAALHVAPARTDASSSIVSGCAEARLRKTFDERRKRRP